MALTPIQFPDNPRPGKLHRDLTTGRIWSWNDTMTRWDLISDRHLKFDGEAPILVDTSITGTVTTDIDLSSVPTS